MKVLLVGSGGREHAIAWKLAQSRELTSLFCAPGNPGTAELGENVPIKADDVKGLLQFCKKESIDLTVVGPENPLSLGITDRFKKEGLKIFGPSRAAAMLESSKSFAKEIMSKAGVKTAACQVVNSLEEAHSYLSAHPAPIVLKADGLASGKGVFVCPTNEEVNAALNELFNVMKVEKLVIEEMLEGKEASYIVATDGERIVPLAASNDYKRIFDNDAGPNTGGMGTVSPTPNLSKPLESEALKRVIEPVLKEMSKKEEPFCGFLYGGLMVSPRGEINVIEFNVRLGDPETQVIMRRMDGDLLALITSLVEGRELPEIRWEDQAAVCVVLASEGYPGKVNLGDEITGIEEAEKIPGVKVFHAGTTLKEGKLLTAGGRVLNVTALGADREQARERAYKAAELINFRGKQFRSDIALR